MELKGAWVGWGGRGSGNMGGWWISGLVAGGGEVGPAA